MATSITRHAGATPADWHGNGSFRRFLESLDLAPLRFNWKVAGGIIYDPVRHAHAVVTSTPTDQEWTGDASILAFARQLHQDAEVPLLTPAHYGGPLRAAVRRSRRTWLPVSGNCQARAGPLPRSRARINRADVDFVLRGLVFRRHRFEEHANTPADLAARFATNVRSLCLREQKVLVVPTETIIRNWIGSTA